LIGGDILDDMERVRRIIAGAGGVARTADFNAAGYANYAVSDMCNRGLIERIRSGYYALPALEQREEEVVARLFPDGIVCMDSALFHYGYSDKTPLEWHLSFPRTVTRSRFKANYPPVRYYMVQPSILNIGVTSGDFNGVTLTVYDRERTICDCFKRRSEMDSELFAKAVNAYAADENKNLGNLSQYARKLHVYAKVTELMEVLLGG
jgi:predicted transcriptional regulator of viral defense system